MTVLSPILIAGAALLGGLRVCATSSARRLVNSWRL